MLKFDYALRFKWMVHQVNVIGHSSKTIRKRIIYPDSYCKYYDKGIYGGFAINGASCFCMVRNFTNSYYKMRSFKLQKSLIENLLVAMVDYDESYFHGLKTEYRPLFFATIGFWFRSFFIWLNKKS